LVGERVRVSLEENCDVHPWGGARGLKLRSHSFDLEIPNASTTFPCCLGRARIATLRDGCAVSSIVDIDSECKLLRELMELEPGNKWVLSALCDVISCDESRLMELLPLLQQLQMIDTKRKAMYRDREARIKLLLQAQETSAPISSTWHPSLNPHMPLFVE
jgi:hypothetical protein